MRVPPAAVQARLEQTAGPSPVLTVDGTLAVEEPGMPTTATVHLAPKGKDLVLSFDASSAIPRLDGVPRLGPLAKGALKVGASGTMNLGTGQLDARAQATIDRLDAGTVQLGSARLTAHAIGPARQSLAIDADVAGADLAIGPLRFDKVRLRRSVGRRPTPR